MTTTTTPATIGIDGINGITTTVLYYSILLNNNNNNYRIW